ncbi:MAG: hypothetical protein ACXVCY_06355 [Pseudobdellovibrionaceae bacterium]
MKSLIVLIFLSVLLILNQDGYGSEVNLDEELRACIDQSHSETLNEFLNETVNKTLRYDGTKVSISNLNEFKRQFAIYDSVKPFIDSLAMAYFNFDGNRNQDAIFKVMANKIHVLRLGSSSKGKSTNCFEKYLNRIAAKYDLDPTLWNYSTSANNAKKYFIPEGAFRREFVLFNFTPEVSGNLGLSWTNRAGTMFLSLPIEDITSVNSLEIERQFLHEYYVQRDLGQSIKGNTINQKYALSCYQVQWSMTQYRADKFVEMKMNAGETNSDSNVSCSEYIEKYASEKIKNFADLPYLTHLNYQRFSGVTRDQFFNSVNRDEVISTQCDSNLFQSLDDPKICMELTTPKLSPPNQLPNSTGPGCAGCAGGE